MILSCPYYAANICRSCRWLEQDYAQQIERKQQQLNQLLQPFADIYYEPPVLSPLSGFRNKAKLVVSGTVDQPVLGIMTDEGAGADLSDCLLYPAEFKAVFGLLTQFVRRAQLTPYSIARRKGELKYILLTRSHFNGEWMIRFVLRSTDLIERLQRHLPALQQQLPNMTVVSANIQPVAMAILEGDEEILLSEQSCLYEQLNDVPLYLRPRSFFQTNPVVAGKLYAAARQWSRESAVKHLWDLFCGAGGFGLHCAEASIHLTGIEINQEAIASARQSAQQMGLLHTQFMAMDAAQLSTGVLDRPDLIVVNPPRRGLGQLVCSWLEQKAPMRIIYSSCNAETLARDLELLTSYQPVRAQLYDMFPHTHHFETLVLLQRR